MTETGFTNMAGAAAADRVPEIGIGMLGYAFMGKAHSNAFKKLPYMMYPPVAVPRLVAIAGRNEGAVREAAARYGYASHYTDWRKLIQDDRVQLFDNGGPNDLHADADRADAADTRRSVCLRAGRADQQRRGELVERTNVGRARQLQRLG